MKKNHRIRRSTTQPQPGTLGAPLLGVFLIKGGTIDPAGGFGYVRAISIDSTGQEIAQPRWLEGTVIPASAVKMSVDDVEHEVESVEVYGDGSELGFSFAPYTGSGKVWVEAMEPSLISSQGLACGGMVAYASGA